MATRFYAEDSVLNGGALFRAGAAIWDDTTGMVPWPIYPYRNNVGITSWGWDEATTTNNWDVGLVQFVGPPMDAQSIGGTLKAYFQVLESISGANFVSQLAARVVSNDGTTVRGTLYGGDTSTTHTSEWSTARTARAFPRAALLPVSLSSVSAQRGDRLLVEIGFEAHNTGGTAVDGDVWFGTTTAGSDLPENETDTDTSKVGWIELSQDLIFAGSPVWSPQLKARTRQGELLQL